MARTFVVGICGYAQSGKSTLAVAIGRELAERSRGIRFRSSLAPFARPLKRIAMDGFGWDGTKDEMGRGLLRDLGGAGRRYDRDVWVKAWESDWRVWLDHGEAEPEAWTLLVDDLRYPNEEDAIRACPRHLIVRVNRKSVMPRRRPWWNPFARDRRPESERPELIRADIVFANDGDLAALHRFASQVVDVIVASVGQGVKP